MNRTIRTIITALAIGVMAAAPSWAQVELYQGTLELLKTSGKACEGLKSKYDVEMSVEWEDNGAIRIGFFEGNEISIGRFSGADPAQMALFYPYHDEFRASGHTLGITRVGKVINGELHDRHIEDTVDECNFDLARLSLKRSGDGGQAKVRLKRAGNLFDAHLARSEGFALTKDREYTKAIPLYEKALTLAENTPDAGEQLLLPYIAGLANVYIMSERFDDFVRLYDRKLGQIQDTTVRGIFTGHRARLWFLEGRKAAGREDLDAALQSYLKAYQLEPRDKDYIAAIMLLHLKAGRNDAAIAFLDTARKQMETERDKREIREALALAYFQKARVDDRTGKDAEAEEALNKAMAFDPETVFYLVALARQRHKAGRYDEAAALLKNALDRFKDEASHREIQAAAEKLRLIEGILRKIRKEGH